VVAGIVTGCIYGLLATAFSVVYSATGLINFAIGAQAMLGAYVTFAYLADLPVWLRLALGVAVSAAVAAGTWQLLYRRLAGRDLIAAVIMSFGVAVVLEELVRISAGSASIQATPLVGRGVLDIGPISVSAHYIFILVTAALVFGVTLWQLGSGRGLAIQATFQDRETAEIVGVRSSRLILLLVLASGAISGVAGIIAAPLLSLSPGMGLQLTLVGFVGAILGGISRVSTAIAGSLCLGLADSLFAGYVSADFRTALVYGALALVLVARPAGLLGSVMKVKV
jgi:branched-chain amino acid transport system permease protein